MTSAPLETVTGVVTLAATGGCAAALAALHLLPTGLSPLRNAVSQYGITDYRLGYRVQTIAMGCAAIAAAIGIQAADLPGCGQVSISLWLLGLSRLVISWFPMDLPGTARTVTGTRHGLLALVAFGAATVAGIHLGASLNSNDRWGSAAAALLWIGVEMLAALVLLGASRHAPALRGCFGLVERGFYLGTLALLSVVGAELALKAH